MTEIPEVRRDRVIGVDALDRQQHSLRLGQWKQVVGEALYLKYRNAIVNGGVPEIRLPVDRAIAGDAVLDLIPDGIERIRLGGVEPRVPGDEVIGIVWVRARRFRPDARCVET